MKFLSCSLTLVVAVAALSSNGACAGRNNRRRHKGAGTSTGNYKTQATTTTTAAKSTFKCQSLGRGCYNDGDCCQNGNVGVVCSYKSRVAMHGTCAAPTTTTTTTAAPFAFTTSSAPGLSQQELQSYLDIYEKSARETEMEISRLKEYIDGMTGSDSEFTRTTERPYRRLRALQLTSTGARNASNPIRATLIKPLTMTDLAVAKQKAEDLISEKNELFDIFAQIRTGGMHMGPNEGGEGENDSGDRNSGEDESGNEDTTSTTTSTTSTTARPYPASTTRPYNNNNSSNNNNDRRGTKRGGRDNENGNYNQRQRQNRNRNNNRRGGASSSTTAPTNRAYTTRRAPPSFNQGDIY